MLDVKKSPFNTVIDHSHWIPLHARSKSRIGADELRIKLKKPTVDSHPKMTILLGEDVLKILNITKKDKVVILQDPNNEKHFLLAKGAKGFAVTFVNEIYGRLTFTFKTFALKEFNAKSIEYSIHPNNSITFYL